MIVLNSVPSRTAFAGGREYIYFIGTSYLGINHNQEFKNYIKQGIDLYGTNYGSSRISNVQIGIFEEAEGFLANLSGAEAALICSSGYMAGQIAISCFSGAQNIYIAPGSHPSVSQVQPFNGNYKEWVVYVLDDVNKVESGPVVIVSNVIDPLRCSAYSFDWLYQLPADKEIYIILDDAHGLGVLGKNGGGVYASLPKLENIQFIITASLGKAYGMPGGVVLSNQAMINKLKTAPIYTGSSPVAPAYLYALIHSSSVFSKARAALQENINLFNMILEKTKLFRFIEGFPVYYTPYNDLCPFLEKHDILISSFPYPSLDGPSITRVVINSLHTKEDIIKLTGLVKGFQKNYHQAP